MLTWASPTYASNEGRIHRRQIPRRSYNICTAMRRESGRTGGIRMARARSGGIRMARAISAITVVRYLLVLENTLFPQEVRTDERDGNEQEHRHKIYSSTHHSKAFGSIGWLVTGARACCIYTYTLSSDFLLRSFPNIPAFTKLAFVSGEASARSQMTYAQQATPMSISNDSQTNIFNNSETNRTP